MNPGVFLHIKMLSKNPIIADMLGIAIEPTYFDLNNCELHPSEVVLTVKNTGANTIRLGMFSHQGQAYYSSKVAPEAPFLNGRNLLDEFEIECRKQNIRLVVYINSKWVTDLYGQHPDWIVKLNGKPYTFLDLDKHMSIMLYPMCPSSPFMDYFRKIVEEIAATGKADAIYIDNFGIEPFCECIWCRKRFGERIPPREDWNSLRTQKYSNWFVRESRKIARSVVASARSTNPKIPVIFNRGIFWTETVRYSPEDNHEYAHKIADGIHTESAVRFYNQPFEHINEQCAFGRSIGLPVWTWVEYAMYPFSYIPPSPEEAKIKAAKVMANGGRPMVWNMPWAPPVSQKGMPGIRAVFKLVSRHKDIFSNVDYDKFTGIVFSSKSLRAYCLGNAEKIEEFKKEFAGAYELMIRNHIPYDFLLDRDMVFHNLKNYRVIILPNVIHLTPAQCREIRRYLRNGGAVFATYETSLYGREGKRMKNFALRDIFGAKYVADIGEQSPGYSVAYSKFVVNHTVNKNGLKENLFPAGGKYISIVTKNAIAVLLKRCRYYCDYPQEETAHPSIVARRYGKGKVIYIPGEFFRLYHCKGFLEYSQFFRQSIEWFTNNLMPVVTDLPDTVESTVTRNKTGHGIIHLVNCSFDRTRPVSEIIPVRGKYFSIKTDRAYRKIVDISTDRRLNFRKENGYLRISLPALTGYNIIVMQE